LMSGSRPPETPVEIIGRASQRTLGYETTAVLAEQWVEVGRTIVASRSVYKRQFISKRHILLRHQNRARHGRSARSGINCRMYHACGALAESAACLLVVF